MCLKKIYDSGEIQRGCSFTSSVKAAKITHDTCTQFEGGQDCFCAGELCNFGHTFKPSNILWPLTCLVISLGATFYDYKSDY